MSAITVHRTPSLHDTLGQRLAARATRIDRFMMHAALAVEASVARRLERRAATQTAAAVVSGKADERRRDAAATTHIGLLPR